ncbi:MAG: hypothetical protein ABI585_03160 [Betaproteobacteria bacterium]
MKNRTFIAIAGLPLFGGLALAFVVNHAWAQGTLVKNDALADGAGRTLYTFDQDAAGKSACNGGCAAAWPPFAASEAEKAQGGYTIVVRDDGSRQWALDGKPLYRFAADAKPGDALGDGQGGVWHVVKRKVAASATANFPRSSY